MSHSNSDNNKPRYDWYETDQHIVLNILVKKMSPDAVSIQFEPQFIQFKYVPKDNDGDDLMKELNLTLNGSISPSECSYHVSAVKAEIKMKKLVPNLRWGILEKVLN